jgi:hypothetical protein
MVLGSIDYCNKCYSSHTYDHDGHDHPSSHVFYALNYVIPSHYAMQTANLYAAGESHPSLLTHTTTPIGHGHGNGGTTSTITVRPDPISIDDIWSLPSESVTNKTLLGLSSLIGVIPTPTLTSTPIIRSYHPNYLDQLVMLESECFGSMAWYANNPILTSSG